jgi:cytochrome P450
LYRVGVTGRPLESGFRLGIMLARYGHRMTESAPVEDWTTDYDISDAGYIENPVPIWKDMRERCPIAHTERFGGSWNPTRFDDIRELAKMVPELSSRQPLVMPPPPGYPELSVYEQQIAAAPITADPPIQTWTRRMLLPAFAPKTVNNRYSGYTEELCHSLIDGFIAAGRCDGAVDYAQQIPPRVIAHMLGVDPEMADTFVGWVNASLGEALFSPEKRLEAREAIREFLGAEVEARITEPREDLLTELIHMEVEDDEADITTEVVVGIANLLLVAGIDTTWSSIGSALWHLGTNPDDRSRLVAEPDLLSTAVEEFLRYYSPVTMARIADVDVDYADVRFEAGDKILMNFPAANHDPEHFEDPDEFIIDRQRNRHVAFGSGIHRCAGSNLARLEMTTAVKVWLERIPEFHVSDREATTWSAGQVRGPRILPMTFPAGQVRSSVLPAAGP